MSEWIEHDGESFPVREGELVEVEARGLTGKICDRMVAFADQPAWYRQNFMKYSRPGYRIPLIVRYRVIRPIALQQLIVMAATIPAHSGERVDV